MKNIKKLFGAKTAAALAANILVLAALVLTPMAGTAYAAVQVPSGPGGGVNGPGGGNPPGGGGGGGGGGSTGSTGPLQLSHTQANGDTCGGGKSAVKTSIKIGCAGKGNPILDMTFAFIRFLSYGAGLVIVGSLILAGIQYSTSRGDPQASAAAQKRIQSTILALLIFIFASAILDYVLPGQVLK